MTNTAITFGGMLVVLGLGAYLGSGRESFTALIPAFFGLPMALLGIAGRAESRRKHMMHAAATLALLGFFGSVRGIPAALKLAGGEEVARPTAAVVQTAMAVICVAFLIFAIRSFVQARRARVA